MIDIIKTNKKIVFIFSTYVYLTNGDSFPIGLDFYNPLDTSNPDIVWKGNTFEYERIIPELTKKVKGTFSEDGTVLTYFKCEYVYSITLPKLTDKNQVYKEERGFTFVNIPFHSYYSPNQVEYNLLTSEGLKEHMSEIYKNLYCAKKDGNIEIKIDSIYWSGGYFSFIIY